MATKKRKSTKRKTSTVGLKTGKGGRKVLKKGYRYAKGGRVVKAKG